MIRKTIFLTVVASLVVAIFLIGCEKEKAAAPMKTTSSGTCKILDKLPKDLVKPLAVNYGNKIKLLGVAINEESPNKLKVSYYWQVEDELGPYNRVFVHFTDQNNKSLFQDDHDFCQNHSFEEIKGKFVEESDSVAVPVSAKGKEVSVKMGMYGLSAGRLKITETSGMPTDEEKTRALVAKIKL